MAETYQSMYQNEIRALELTINDQDGAVFAPSAAYTSVRDSDGTTVVAEQDAQVDNNQIRTIIGTAVTATPGEYDVIWRIITTEYTYYHITQLEIQEL
jgi:hypothetical protein